MAQQIQTEEKPLQEAIQEADEIQYFVKKDGYVLVVSNEKLGTASIYFMKAFCVGMLKGIAYGAGQGISDDAAIFTTAFFLVANPDEFNEALEQVQGQMLVRYLVCFYFYPQHKTATPSECYDPIFATGKMLSGLVLTSAYNVITFADTEANSIGH